MNPSLIDLFKFAPKDETENIVNPGEIVIQEYMETTKSHWAGGNYWLGGQIKLSPHEKITDEMLKKVTDIYANPSNLDYCNSWEYASAMSSMRKFFEIDGIIHLCAFIMRMATLLFADETPILWAFSMRKGVKPSVSTKRNGGKFIIK